MIALPGHRPAGAHHLDRGRRGHPARGRCGRARGLRLRGRSDLGRSLLRRRQRRDERRRQEGRAVGHGAGQPGLLAHGHAPGRMAGGHAPRPQPGQDPRRRKRGVRAAVLRGRRQDAAAHRAAGDPRHDLPQGRPGQGRHRQVPVRPAGHPEGRLRRPDHQRPLGGAPHARAHAHGVPRVLRQCQGRGAQHRRDQGLHVRRAEALGRAAGGPGAPGRPLPEGGRLRDQVQEARRRCRRWCCSATSPATTPTPWRAPPPRWCASPIRAAAKASSRSAPRRARSSGSTASARRRSASTPTPSRSTKTW